MICGGAERKGQESMLNIMATVLVVSVIFLYFFYVTQSQKAHSSQSIAEQLNYKYGEIALMNMYYVKPPGLESTVSEVIGTSLLVGDEDNNYRYMALNSWVEPERVVKDYLDRTMADYSHYFYAEKDGLKYIEVNEMPPEGARVMAHMIVIPVPESGGSANAYLYVW